MNTRVHWSFNKVSTHSAMKLVALCHLRRQNPIDTAATPPIAAPARRPMPPPRIMAVVGLTDVAIAEPAEARNAPSAAPTAVATTTEGMNRPPDRRKAAANPSSGISESAASRSQSIGWPPSGSQDFDRKFWIVRVNSQPYHRPVLAQGDNMAVFRYSGIRTRSLQRLARPCAPPNMGTPPTGKWRTGYGPCRLCLHTFAIDQEDRLLFTYQPFLEPGSLPAPGPVFVHAEPCQRYDALDFPPDFRQLPLVVEGFRTNGTLVIQERVEAAPPEQVVAQVFGVADVAYAHLRNGEAGCYMARVDRCYACD